MVFGDPVPTGIPASFLADHLSLDSTAEQVLSGKQGVIVE
jgi:hypothetical protein